MNPPTDDTNQFDLPDLDATTPPPPEPVVEPVEMPATELNTPAVNEAGLPDIGTALPPAPIPAPVATPPNLEVPPAETTVETDQPVVMDTKKGSEAGPIVAGVLVAVLLVGGGVFALFGQSLLSTFRGDVRQQAALIPQCRDGRDNDGDGKIDCVDGVADPGCFPDGHGGGGACNTEKDNERDDVSTAVVQSEVLTCGQVQFYWNNNGTWTKDTPQAISTKVEPNTAIRLATKPVDGTAEVARFRVNDGDWMESSTKNDQGEFYIAYTPTSFTTFKVDAQVGAYGYAD